MRNMFCTSAMGMEALGSSMMSSLQFFTTALAISTICIWAVESICTWVDTSIFTPRSAMTSSARRRISRKLGMKRPPSFSPRKMFSMMLSDGTRFSSWYTTPTPASRAMEGVRCW